MTAKTPRHNRKAPVDDWASKTALSTLLSIAMQDSKRIKVRYDDIVPFYKGLLSESERAIGILSFAFIESKLLDLFTQQLDPKVQGGIESILGPQGILDGVGAQIRMLHALGWLRAETVSGLRLLAKIRNRFAHAHTALTFEDTQVRGYFSSLTNYEEEFASDFPGLTLQTRHKYLVRSLVTLFWLLGDLSLMPSSHRAGLGPTEVFAAKYRKYPTELRNALKACMNAVKLIHLDARRTQPKKLRPVGGRVRQKKS